jgi:hypothetical protein
MELTENEIEEIRQIFQEEVKAIEKSEKDPNTCWGMYYFGFDYEQEPKILFFKTIEDARIFSQRVDPSLRSLGWFPITEKENNPGQKLEDTQIFLSKLYKELESKNEENILRY